MPWFPGMSLPIKTALEYNYNNVKKAINSQSSEQNQNKKDNEDKKPFIPTVEKR